MRLSYVTILICTVCTSCLWKPYPKEKYEIENNYRNLISAYKTGDTMIFKSSQNSIDSFVISGIDSTIFDEKGYLIDRRNSKSITITYRQIPVDKWQFKWTEGRGDGELHEHAEDGTFISIEKFPDDQTTNYYFDFKEFRCSKNEIPKLKRDTIEINGSKITNYYKIDNCDISSTDSNRIQVCFSTINKGLVAFITNNNISWTRQN